MTRKCKKRGILRCKSCGEIIFMDGECMPGSSRSYCASCRYVEVRSKGRDPDKYIRALAADSDLDEFDYEMIGDPDFDIEEYLQ